MSVLGNRVPVALWCLLLAMVFVHGAAGPALAQEKGGFTDPSLLISTEELAGLLDDLTTRIIDLREPEKFQEGRIPFALSLPPAAIIDPGKRISGSRLSDARLAEMFGLLGIGKENQVVLYDDQGGHQAARVLWILQHFGHQKVSVLDGGFPRWRDEDRHITQQVTQVKRESFPLELAPRRLATADWILDHLDDPDVVIVDVRPKARYEESHVPGAINIFWKDNLESDDTWKDPQKLLELYEAAGITKDKSIVTYCQGGVHNGLTYLTLKALGYPQVRSYDLAWPEWGSDPSLPVSSGPEPGGVSIQDAGSGPDGVSRQLTKAGEDSGFSTLEAGLIAALAVTMVVTVAVVLGFWRALRRRAPGM